MNDEKTLSLLVKKFHPSKVAMHPKTAFFIGAFLGQDWVTGPPGEKSTDAHFSITADEFVVSGDMFLGSWEDIQTNLLDAAKQSKLTAEEKKVFNELFQARFTDWRNLTNGRKVCLFLS